MDALSDLLHAVRLRAAVFLHSHFCGTWAVDTSGQHQATFHLVARGTCWLHLPGGNAPIALQGGDLVAFPRDARHLISDSPTPPDPATPLNQPGGDPSDGPSTTLICGYFAFESGAWNPLRDALPEVIVIRSDQAAATGLMDGLIRALIHEADAERPGADMVIDRLSEVLFVHIVRSMMQDRSMDPGYLAALADGPIGRVLTAIHGQPSLAWTVERLAERAHMSRSAFAERFHRLVGLAPMRYVARWRMERARTWLETTRQSTSEIAERLGYRSEAAFSKAFKRELGVGPGAVRRAARSEGGQGRDSL